jgi:hypothetical protein
LIAASFQQLSAQCAPGTVFQTARHYNNTNASLPFGNTVTTTTSSSSGAVDFTPNSTIGTEFNTSFQTTTNFITGGGSFFVDIDDTEAGAITYTFCRPLTNPYIFIGGLNIQQGTVITAVGQSLTRIDGLTGFVVQGGNQITNDGTGASMVGGYVQVNGTISSLTLNLTNAAGIGTNSDDIFNIAVGSCLTPTPPVGVPVVCNGPNVMTPINFQAIGATPAMFNSQPQISPNLFTNLYDENGQKVDVNIETLNATPNYCGNFSNNASVNGSVITNTTTVGGGVAYWYTFSRPIKTAINSVGVLPLKEGESIMITTFTGGANPAIATITGGSGLISTQAPSFSGVTVIEGSIVGAEWKVEPVQPVTRICIVYMTSNPNQTSEAHTVSICNRPCEVRTPVCAVQSTRTNTARFAAPSSANTVNATLGANNITLTTPATAPIVKTRMTESNRLGECSDGDKFMMPRSGGWAEFCAAPGTNGNIVLNFASPVADPNIHIWNMKTGTTIDFTPTGCCVHQVRGWNGATLNNNPGGFATIATDGNGGTQADGIYQISGVYSTITLALNTTDRDWIYISVGEAVCDPTVEAEPCVSDLLYCTEPNTVLRTNAAQYNSGNPSSASGFTFDPEANAYINPLTMNITNSAGGNLSIYDFSAVNGVNTADAGCSANGADLDKVNGGKLKISAAAGSWQNGAIRFSFGQRVTNPLIRISKLVNTRLSFAPTFDYCGNSNVPVVQLTSKGGFAVNGCISVQDNNIWGDGMQGSGLVQLIGQFTEIMIDVDKLNNNPDKFEINVEEQVCVLPASVVRNCVSELPSQCFSGGTQLTSNPATFSKTGNNSATGTLVLDGEPININVSSTNQILAASPERAMQAFRDPACFDILPLSGGLTMFRDLGGNNTITYNLGKTICNPIIYVRDLIRTQLSFANTVDVDGNPICCIRRISGSQGLRLTGFNVSDWRPAQDGDCQNEIRQSAGIVQLIGSFNTITINTSRPVDSRFDNYSLSIATDPMCMAVPTPIIVDVKKKIANIEPKDPTNPTGNQIVTFMVEAQNNTGTKINNLFLMDFLDEKFTVGNGFIAIAAAPKVTWPHYSFQHGNPNFNGITEFDLLTTTTENNMLDPGQLIRIEYSVEMNPTQFNPNWRYENKILSGSLNMPVFDPTLKEFNLALCLPSSIMLPTNPIIDIVNGSVPVEFASWLQCYGKTKVIPHPQCGKVTWGYNMCISPYTQNCGNTGVHHSQFMGVDECGNMYMYRADFTSIDKNPPVWDMKPMDKNINCDDATAAADLTKWLSTAGGAWYSDPGDDKKSTITVTHDFNGVNPGCNGGPRTVKFTLTDACGNSTSASANLTVIDTKAPVLIVPANVTVQCGDNIVWGTATATDNCGTANITSADVTVSSDCINGGLIIRTWSATDGCGNVSTKTQTAYLAPSKMVISMIKPVSDKIINCDEAMNFDAPSMQTTCPDGIIKSSYVDTKVNGTCLMEYEVVRTWTFTDNCGNTYEVKQEISLLDNEAPVFEGNLPKTFTMKQSIFNVWKKMYFANYVKANDKCSKATLTAPIFTVLNNKSVECKVIANDECGNAATYVCIVTFEDVKSSNKDASNNSDAAAAILADLEKYVQDETPIDIPVEPVIYPNPTSRMVNVVPAQGYGDLQKIHIYSLDGRILLNMDVEGQDNRLVSIDISNFQNATYIIEMVHANKKLYRQVQKIK